VAHLKRTASVPHGTKLVPGCIAAYRSIARGALTENSLAARHMGLAAIYRQLARCLHNGLRTGSTAIRRPAIRLQRSMAAQID